MLGITKWTRHCPADLAMLTCAVMLISSDWAATHRRSHADLLIAAAPQFEIAGPFQNRISGLFSSQRGPREKHQDRPATMFDHMRYLCPALRRNTEKDREPHRLQPSVQERCQ